MSRRVVECGAQQNAPSSTSTTTAVSTTTATTTPTGAGARFTVSPTSLVVGEPVTFSGDGCTGHTVAMPSISVTSASDGTQTVATPRADGSWRATVRVANGTFLGARSAVASCVQAGTHAILFDYRAVPVRVSTFRHLEVSPATTVAAGIRLTVRAIGACPLQPPLSYVSVDLRFAVNRFDNNGQPIDAIARDYPEADAGGNWTAHLTMPTGAEPGSYLLGAVCDYSRLLTAFYPDVPITVVAR